MRLLVAAGGWEDCGSSPARGSQQPAALGSRCKAWSSGMPGWRVRRCAVALVALGVFLCDVSAAVSPPLLALRQLLSCKHLRRAPMSQSGCRGWHRTANPDRLLQPAVHMQNLVHLVHACTLRRTGHTFDGFFRGRRHQAAARSIRRRQGKHAARRYGWRRPLCRSTVLSQAFTTA